MNDRIEQSGNYRIVVMNNGDYVVQREEEFMKATQWKDVMRFETLRGAKSYVGFFTIHSVEVDDSEIVSVVWDSKRDGREHGR